MDYVIQVTDLVKSFGKETVLHHINMNFAPGKIHGIIGRNGSGKTMLMKCICGFIPVTSGKVTVFGKVIGSLKRKNPKCHAIGWARSGQ